MPDLGRERGLMACTLCWNAMPDGEWCRACGEGLPEPPIEPMTGLRLAVRIAKGGPLSSDGSAEIEAFHAGLRQRSLSEAAAGPSDASSRGRSDA